MIETYYYTAYTLENRRLNLALKKEYLDICFLAVNLCGGQNLYKFGGFCTRTLIT